MKNKLLDTELISIKISFMGKESKGGFLSNLLSSLFGSQDADADKKRQLKNISKRLAKSKFKNFYKFSGNEILPPLGKQFYDIYKAIYPVQAMFNAIQNPNMLKHIVISFSLPDNIKTLEESLSEENIRKLAKEIPIANLSKQANERLSTFSDYFTLEKITEIDYLYKQLIALKTVATYDYYFFLKKFDKSIRENDFTSLPHFEKVNAEYLADDLKDYIESVWDIPFDAEWTNLFKLLKSFKGTEPISLGLWKRLVSRLYAIRMSGAMEMIIQLASGNPSYVPNIQSQNTSIIEPYLDKIKNDVEKTINELVESEKTAKTNDFASQLFGDVEINQIKNYTDALKPTFERKGLKYYLNYQALNYMKTFLIEIVKKDLREYYDLVIVRGEWSTQSLCTPFSDCYNSLLNLSDKITSFDNELAEDAAIGIRIKTMLPKTERDSVSKNSINRLVNDANETAYNLIMEGLRCIITIGKIVKSLVDDCSKTKPELVTNWKALEHYADNSVKNISVALYKKIYLFTSLEKACLVQVEE